MKPVVFTPNRRYFAAWLAGMLVIGAHLASPPEAAGAATTWTSPNNHRVLLEVDPKGVVRSNSPASLDINLPQILTSLGISGTFDEHTIEVIGYYSSGAPVVYDESRPGYEQYLLPWRIQKYFGIDKLTLSFVMPSHSITRYAVYFDTVESGLGKPQRYRGLVGDGDWFREDYKRREINACKYDAFVDFDGDGDLDLFKGGTEPYLYYYENVGGNKFIERGRLTSGGELFTFPHDGNNRSWLAVEFCDWDGDGDQDMFVYFATGPYAGHVVRYENTTTPGGLITFVDRGPLTTQSGVALRSTITIVDWDGDGKKDILSWRDGFVVFHKNIGPDNNIQDIRLADGVYLKANGLEIQLWSVRMDCADIDGDGDLDLFVAMEDGRVYLFINVGTRTAPVLAEGRLVAYHDGGYMDAGAGVKVADFDGDGLLDFVVGRYWERTHWGEEPRMYGRLYKNIGTPTAPRFEARDAYGGAPYTERFQQCDAVRQNGVRGVDWNNDGRTDLIASDTDGFVWYFRNTTNHKFPIFAPGERLMADGEYIRVLGEEERRVRDGYARVDICDWNEDGRKDLVVADGRGWITLYLNVGTDDNPVFGPGSRLHAYNENGVLLPIDGTARSSVLVCDWDNDGKKDVIHAVTGQHNYSVHYNWPWQDSDPTDDSGFLFFKNIGTNAAPVLAYPKWIRGGGQIITYNSRPNLGSFVDWDGDGKKDFITGEFESSVRFYKNIGSGAPNTEPEFADTAGVTVVRPFSVQMISGADAIDWNRDGDLDILTGQGHGGTGLRFYERDYINDFVNNTFPAVAIGSSARAFGIAEAKLLADGASVMVPRGIVTASFDSFFYVESDDRESGIRVEMNGHGRSVGQQVEVTGSMATNSHGERFVAEPSVLLNGSGSVAELGITNAALGGGAFVHAQTGAGQIGVTGGTGLNNIGLLVKTFGKCTLNLANSGTGGDYYGNYYLFIDDGSGIVSWYRASDGSYQQAAGVKVEIRDSETAAGAYVAARGISSIELVNGTYQRRILAREGMGDIVRF